MTTPETSSATHPAFISVENLSKRFGDKLALDDVSLHLPKGETMAIIGPSAAGKSVLMKCLVGIYGADAAGVRMGLGPA